MDLTFIEQEPYFLSTTTGELSTTPSLPTLPSPTLPRLVTPIQPTASSPPESFPLQTPTPESSPFPTQNPTTSETSTHKTPPTNLPPIKNVYNRREKIPESILQSTTCRELDMDSVANIETPTAQSKSSSPTTATTGNSSTSSKSPSQNLDDFPIAIRKGVRACTKHPILRFCGYTSLMPCFKAFTATLDARQIPKTVDEALRDPKWKKAVEEELTALENNATWTVTNLPPDVKNAFLNGHLDEEVYMKIPPGLQAIGGSKKVCRLHKSLYGLKQSPRAWFERFTKVILRNGYKQSLAGHTLFLKEHSNGKKAILLVYVDDIIITGDDEGEIAKLKQLLNSEFETKDLGFLRYFLGMEVARSKEGLVINQRKYILDLLQEAGLLGCKPAETPMDINLAFHSATTHFPHKDRFQRIVGKLIYLSLTRPDIAFAVNILSQHMSNPNEEHMAAAYKVLKYLKKTPGHGLLFKKSSDRSIKVFTDSSWASNLTDQRSTSGYCTFLWGNLVTWRSKKQSVISRSSAEAEFRALAQGICECIWLLKLLREVDPNSADYFELLSDNNSAIQIAKNPVQHDSTKHVEINRHFIAEKIKKGTTKLFYIPTDGQLADILTKALPKPAFDSFKCKLGIYNVYTPA
ncbi:hypothetical protein V6N11_008637 [Hibiscus sabdariffa]|uniref:Reverse transcriptase Ty1/copia-type domain-containing protein n=1 Tax=Hibiscus sabdariffa TaxID=183260 RepID=A0ABR2PPC5_9ROSI